MAAPSERSKLSKSERKLAKKAARTRHSLENQLGIQTQSHPSKRLYVANGGLGNGITREYVFELFAKHGHVDSIEMARDKPYCFVQFESVESSMLAVRDIHGKKLEFQCNSSIKTVYTVTFYLAYVSEVNMVKKLEFCEKKPSCECPLPPGLVMLPDYVERQYEEKLLKCINWTCVESDSEKSLKNRRVKHYGYEFIYGANDIDKDHPLDEVIPDVCVPLLDSLVNNGYLSQRSDQLTINQYQPGQGIPAHIDTHSAFEDGIVSLSLGSSVVMDFKRPDGVHIPVLLPRRSVIIMTGESRYLWSHGITPRKSDIVPTSQQITGDGDLQTARTADDKMTLSMRQTRTSFTFRKIRRKPCECAFAKQCDSQADVKKSEPDQNLPKTPNEALSLEKEHVHQVYEEIAGHFSGTRHTPWPKVVDFLNSQPPFSLVLDIGCGNGKYLAVGDNLIKVGCDRSSNLINICHQRGFEAFVCDCLDVPLKSNVFDVILSIAVIHHLSTEERRLRAIKELVRLLKPGGQGLVYVWALEQQLHKLKSKYLKPKFDDTHDNVLQAINNEETLTCETQQDLQRNSAGIDHDKVAVEYQRLESKDNKLPVHKNRTEFVKPDLLVPWHLKATRMGNSNENHVNTELKSDKVFHRFYHVFQQGELESLCQKLEDIKIVQSYYDQGNWCLILEKNL